MINSQHEKWWRILFDSGLLDRIEHSEASAVDAGAKEANTIRTMRVPNRAGGTQASYADLRYIPRVLLTKFTSLLDEIEQGRRTASTMEALASFYVVGIATPIVSDLAEFCRTYPYNSDPNKEETLKYMIRHLRKYVAELQSKMRPYPYLNETKWQMSMQDDFRTITSLAAEDKCKVPAGYPCIVRCRRSGNSFAVKTAYILVNGAALAFTVPWIHSASTLPRSFDIKGMKDGYGLFGIVCVSEEDLEDIYRIGLTPPSDVYHDSQEHADLKKQLAETTVQLRKFQPTKVDLARKIQEDPKSVKGVTAKHAKAAINYITQYDELKAGEAKLRKDIRLLESHLRSNLPHSRMQFYPLDILICKVLDSEVTRPVVAPYDKVDSLLAPYRPNVPVVDTLKFINQPKGRKWKLTVE